MSPGRARALARTARLRVLTGLAVLGAATAPLLIAASVLAQRNAGSSPQWVEGLASAVVRIKAHIDPQGYTVAGLGREREGSGIVIDDDGLVVTIGYLMVEAYAAEVTDSHGRTMPANVVGYDHETGFGLLRVVEPERLEPKPRPMPLGKSAAVKVHDPVLIASSGGSAMVGAAYVVAKREFAGSWEYLLDEARFTAPPHPAWSGAALINSEGRLVGVGSLIVGDAASNGENVPGNMFVPIDRLPPILADLIADGRVAGPGRPWLGLSADELRGRLLVARVTPAGPADKAGIRHGDVIAGVDGEKPESLADFYRKVWARGSAGVTVPLDVLRDGERQRIGVKSINRLDHLKLKSTF